MVTKKNQVYICKTQNKGLGIWGEGLHSNLNPLPSSKVGAKFSLPCRVTKKNYPLIFQPLSLLWFSSFFLFSLFSYCLIFLGILLCVCRPLSNPTTEKNKPPACDFTPTLQRLKSLPCRHSSAALLEFWATQECHRSNRACSSLSAFQLQLPGRAVSQLPQNRRKLLLDVAAKTLQTTRHSKWRNTNRENLLAGDWTVRSLR